MKSIDYNNTHEIDLFHASYTGTQNTHLTQFCERKIVVAPPHIIKGENQRDGFFMYSTQRMARQMAIDRIINGKNEGRPLVIAARCSFGQHLEIDYAETSDLALRLMFHFQSELVELTKNKKIKLNEGYTVNAIRIMDDKGLELDMHMPGDNFTAFLAWDPAPSTTKPIAGEFTHLPLGDVLYTRLQADLKKHAQKKYIVFGLLQELRDLLHHELGDEYLLQERKIILNEMEAMKKNPSLSLSLKSTALGPSPEMIGLEIYHGPLTEESEDNYDPKLWKPLNINNLSPPQIFIEPR